MFKDLILASLKRVTKKENINLEFPENEVFGDYSTNLAMILAKKRAKNPQEVAAEIVEKIRSDKKISGIVEKVEIKGPGFINFYLSHQALLTGLDKILEEKERFGTSLLGKGKTVVIDYSSPNIAKSFGIGHLRSTVIGQALYNLYKSLGYKVFGDNHLGDWGTQFGALLFQIFSRKLDPAKLSIATLEDLYVEFHKKEEENPEIHNEAKKWFKKLEEGDSQAREIWKTIVNKSLEEFERIYELLGVKIDFAYGESFYEDKMPEVIEEIQSKGLLKESEGAQVVELGGMPPGIIIKSDGTTTYLTRDLATIKFRLKNWNPDLFIYEVGSDQILHFRQVFEIARLLGWDKEKRFVHVSHGLIRFLSGKMSTRKGKTIKLEDVLNEAIRKAREIIEKSETGRGLTAGQKEAVATSVGIGATKYFDLMHQPTTDIVFDWEKIFVLEGNSAPYLQYTHARIKSVLAKGGKGQKVDKKASLNNEELLILRSLVRFPDQIAVSGGSFSPNLLANYLFDLAQKFNNFYNQHRIIGGENEEFKMALSASVGQVLKNGLTILGIETPERM